MYLREASRGNGIGICNVTRARSNPSVSSTSRTLRRHGHLLRGVCGCLPMKVRLCGQRKVLVSVGSGRRRVFRLGRGRSLLKVGVFRGPVFPRRVGDGLEGRRGTSFAFQCSFSGVSGCCGARGGANAVSLMAGIADLCSSGRGLAGCLLVGTSGARAAITCGGVRRFRDRFRLVSSCTGIKCTGCSLLGRRNCTRHD